jgi:hypothetical protein
MSLRTIAPRPDELENQLGFILVWIWLFHLGPTDEYWACMDSHARAFKGTYQAEEVFLAADADCSRRAGLTEQAAHAEWLRLSKGL